MSKGQQRSNREPKKPKAEKPKAPVASSFSGSLTKRQSQPRMQPAIKDSLIFSSSRAIWKLGRALKRREHASLRRALGLSLMNGGRTERPATDVLYYSEGRRLRTPLIAAGDVLRCTRAVRPFAGAFQR